MLQPGRDLVQRYAAAPAQHTKHTNAEQPL